MDLIPGLGDIAGAVLSCYIIWVGMELEMPTGKIFHMVRNVIVDFLLGILPVIGPVFDLFYRSNQMNLKIIDDFHRNIVEGEVIK